MSSNDQREGADGGTTKKAFRVGRPGPRQAKEGRFQGVRSNSGQEKSLPRVRPSNTDKVAKLAKAWRELTSAYQAAKDWASFSHASKGVSRDLQEAVSGETLYQEGFEDSDGRAYACYVNRWMGPTRVAALVRAAPITKISGMNYYQYNEVTDPLAMRRWRSER